MTADGPSFEELERIIGSVSGVAAAQVLRTEHGRGRLRIRLEPGEDPGRASWAVAVTLRERFGIALDPADIRPLVGSETPATAPEPSTDASGPRPGAGASDPESATSEEVADLVYSLLRDLATREPDDDEAAGDAPPPARHVIQTPQVPDRPAGQPDDPETFRPRALIRDLLVTRSSDQVAVTAILAFGSREVAGEATGPASVQGALRASAEATLAALGVLTGGLLDAGIEHVTVSQGDDVEAAMVALTVRTEASTEEVLGAALLRGEPELAVVRATLDALNRRIGRWLHDEAADEAADETTDEAADESTDEAADEST